MAAGFAKLREVFSGNETPLKADLRRATESDVIEVPKELLTAVEHASHNDEDRKEIMGHLRECLAESSGKRWRRVYAGLVMVEDLIRKGSPDLWRETAEGRHFDVVQRVSLLEQFECMTDKRVQYMVRTKASAIREELVPRLELSCEEGPGYQGFGNNKDTNDSHGTSTIPSCSTSVGSSGGYIPERPVGQMILNGVVAVGHNDDTTSESSGDEGTRKAVAYRKSKKAAERQRNNRQRSGDSTDSDGDAPRQSRGGNAAAGQTGARPAPPAPPAPKPPPTPTVDLLDL